MKVSDLLDLGCGLMPEAELKAYLYRRVNGKETMIAIPLQRDGDKVTVVNDPLLEADDLVTIRAIPEYAKITDSYHIEGEVSQPGSYPVYASDKAHPRTLYEALTEAGGVLPTGYIPGIVLYRKRTAIEADVRQKDVALALANLDATNGLVPAAKQAVVAEKSQINTALHPLSENRSENASKNPAKENPAAPLSEGAAEQNPAPSLTPEEIAKQQSEANLTHSLAQTLTATSDSTVVLVIPPRSTQQDYRLSIPIDANAVLASKGKIDFQLEPDDLIYIPKQPTTVTVLGGVVISGATLYQPGQKVANYIRSVGGFASDADTKHLIIMHLNGRMQPATLKSIAQPGDTIIVPTRHIIKLMSNTGALERTFKILSDTAITALPFVKTQ